MATVSPVMSPEPPQAVIGLEVHVQLRTETKIFCRCPHRFGAPPNTLVCPVCLGYPGALPVLNDRAVELAVKLALALEAQVQPVSGFDRKSYFYPDLPKGYQITQHRQPLATGGSLPLTRHPRRIGIERLHLEEDAGKLVHGGPPGGLPGGPDGPGEPSRVDFNRSGAPLVEIVSRPEMSTPEEARDYLQTLHGALRFTDTSDAHMEQGSLRCDANVSVLRPGETALGTRIEIKNLGSFRQVARALEHEIQRQSRRLAEGRQIEPETRSFDDGAGVTRPLRSKETSADYRYLDEPDLPPLQIPEARIRAIRESLPELPWDLRRRLRSAYGVSRRDAVSLSRSRELASYFEAVVGALRATGEAGPQGGSDRAAASRTTPWVLHEALGELNRRSRGADDGRAGSAESAGGDRGDAVLAEALPPRRLAALIRHVEDGDVSARAAKGVLTEIWGSGDEPAAVIERLGLTQVRDPGRLQSWIREVLEARPEEVRRYRQGEAKLLGFLLGQVMERSGGRAAPRDVRRRLEDALREAPGSREESTGQEPSEEPGAP